MMFETLLKGSLALAFALISCGCLVEQTVTRNGQITEEGYVIKRPIKEAIENTKFEE